MDNWVDISEFVRSKSKQECEDHYYSFYNKSKQDNLPKDVDIILKERLKDGEPIIDAQK